MKLKNRKTGLIFLIDGKRAIKLASSSDYEVIESNENEKQLCAKEEIKKIPLEEKLLGKNESTDFNKCSNNRKRKRKDK
jgi:hypothetical protein